MVIVILPAFNEAGAICDLLNAMDEAMSVASTEYRVVVVNDLLLAEQGGSCAVGQVDAAAACEVEGSGVEVLDAAR